MGNLASTIDSGRKTTSTFDAADQTISSIGPFDTLDHQWDANGNQVGVSTASTTLATFTWDYEDRLKSAEIDSLSLRITALYDSDHRRIARTQLYEGDTDSSRFIWDGENVLQVTDNSNVTKVDYTVEPSFYGKLISQKQGADSVYHHFDALGSTQQLTDALGVPIDSYDYSAFGAGGPASGAVPNLFQFVGELGYSADNPFLLYIRRRWYFTFFGRWASRERRVYVLRYVYVISNPVNLHDPSGYSPVFGPIEPSPGPIFPDCPRPNILPPLGPPTTRLFDPLNPPFPPSPAPLPPPCRGACCDGNPYDPKNYCCENNIIVRKVPIWICERGLRSSWALYWAPWNLILPYNLDTQHTYVCCKGANDQCFGMQITIKTDYHETLPTKEGYPIQPEDDPTGYCKPYWVCPKLKESKCKSPVSGKDYGVCLPGYENCHDWAWKGVR